jgi:hypothetical protein
MARCCELCQHVPDEALDPELLAIKAEALAMKEKRRK